MIRIVSLGLPGWAAPQQGGVAGPRRTTKAAAMHRKGTVPGEPKYACRAAGRTPAPVSKRSRGHPGRRRRAAGSERQDFCLTHSSD